LNVMKAKPSMGLRERKRLETRERIAKAAMTLFLERGFDATTVEEIAAAADVSKRSFFDYFPTKEDVVAAWQDSFGSALTEAVAARPAGEPLARVVEEALLAVLATALAQPQALAPGHLVRETPALCARDHLKYARLEDRLVAALSERAPGETDQLRIRLLAMVAVGALRVGSEFWHANPRPEPVLGYVRHLFDTVWAELRTFGATARD
jgi:AcrR family transcriptional regulator